MMLKANNSKFLYYKYYIGCKCYFDDGKEQILTASLYDRIIEGIMSVPKLSLKSIKNISDEDAIYCAKIMFEEQSKMAEDKKLIEVGKRCVYEYFFGASKKKCPNFTSMSDLLTKMFPYLLNKGYNLFYDEFI